jgi:hypothetical protein
MMKDWLGKVVDREDLTCHDKWLCMMMPRLRLIKDLMREDGVIFISNDDNEVHRLRSLMDEIFGDETSCPPSAPPAGSTRSPFVRCSVSLKRPTTLTIMAPFFYDAPTT